MGETLTCLEHQLNVLTLHFVTFEGPAIGPSSSDETLIRLLEVFSFSFIKVTSGVFVLFLSSSSDILPRLQSYRRRFILLFSRSLLSMV